MEPTRRFWAIATLGTVSAVLAILFDNVLYLGVPIGISVWVLVDQLAFTAALSRATESPPVQQRLVQDTVLVDESTTLEVAHANSLDYLTDLEGELTIASHPALTAEGPQAFALDSVSPPLSVTLRVDVAGTYDIEPPTLSVTSHRGLFTETISVGNECTATGEPRVPRDIHIGTGGERIAVAAGEHDAEQGSSGFDPGELREYLPGDPTNRIDWKATARLGEPYVREVEAEGSRQTHLILDQRPAMQAGEHGLTKSDYAREVGIWMVDYVASLDDPLTATFIDEEEARGVSTTDTTKTHYQRVRRELLNQTRTGPDTAPSSPGIGPATMPSGQTARTIQRALTGDSQFTRTLRPYFGSVETYLDHVTDDPLYQSVQSRLAEHTDDSWIVLITDDTKRAELLETTRLAAKNETHVSVFLLPSVLFDTAAFTDLETAYTTYRDFEDFRQQLAAHTNVTAFEVGPRDRLASILQTAQTGRGHQ